MLGFDKHEDLKIEENRVVFVDLEYTYLEDICLTNYGAIIILPPLYVNEEVVVMEREILTALDNGIHVCILINDDDDTLVNNLLSTLSISLVRTEKPIQQPIIKRSVYLVPNIFEF